MSTMQDLFPLIEKGKTSIRDRNYLSAHEELSRAIHLIEQEHLGDLLNDAQLAEVYVLRGSALWYQDELQTYTDPDIFHQVLNDFEQALDMLPQQTVYLNLRGRLYLNASFDDYLQLAEEDFEAALKAAPKDADALKNLGELRAKQERYDQAIQYYTRSLDEQIDKETYLLRGVANFRRIPANYQAAADDFGRAQELLPGLEDLYIWRAQSFLELGEWELAVEEYDRLIDVSPETSSHYVDRGVLKLERDEAAALADFEQALEIAPDPSAYNNRAVLMRMRGDFEMAVSDAKAALKADPEYAVAYATLAEIYADMGDRTAMYDQLKQALATYYDDVVEVMSEPAFEPYIHEPEFQRLLKGV